MPSASANHDRRILRELARQVAAIGQLPVQREKADLWRRLNRLEKIRPLVWINEIPWSEFADAELRRQTADPFWRGIETNLRQTLYQWKYFRADMVVEPVLYACPYACHDTGFGLEVQSLQTGAAGGSRHYDPVIRSAADIEKIKTPVVTADWEAGARNFQRIQEMFSDILKVERRGIVHTWCAPWDVLVQWWGVNELLIDLADRPALVHQGISRLMDALLARLAQWEKLNLLSLSNGNHRVGSGGLGITDLLPQPDCDPARVRPLDQWGTSTGQIFSEVSPDMHEEFCLQYERRWLERYGLNCYGCCEPLHHKLHLLKTIPRLRRVSISTWCDIGKAAAIGADYIFSYKPNPAFLAMDAWNPGVVREDLRRVLDQTRPCRVELILKDISTIRGDPRRLREWADLAMALAAEYSD